MMLIIVLAGIVNYIILAYSDTDAGTKAYIMIMTTLLLMWLFTGKDMHEGFGTIQTISNEAIQNLASVFKNGTLTVDNLQVTGEAKLGNWNIRENRIGVVNGADIAYELENRTLNIYDYGKNNLSASGINASNLVATGKKISLNNGEGNLNSCETNQPCNGRYAIVGGNNNEGTNKWQVSVL